MKKRHLILVLLIYVTSVIAYGQQITLIDFGATNSSTTSPNYWNNFSSLTDGGSLALKDNTGTSTGVNMVNTKAFSFTFASGTNAPTAPASNVFPNTATVDGVYRSDNVKPILTFSNLDPTKRYTFDIFASRTSSTSNRTTLYTVTGSTVASASLDASNNTGNYVTVASIAPNVSTSSITLQVELGSGNTAFVYYLNAVRITAIAPPTASYTSVVSDKDVTFTNTSTNATSYSWDFGDGTSSTSASPVHTYSNYGTYSVVLSATNVAGTVTSTQSINISASVQPTSSYTYAVSDKDVTFTNTSTNATSYSWDFGDGTSSTSTNPVHTYSSYGDYSVVLSAINASGTVTSTQSFTLAALVQPTSSYTYAISDKTITFTNNSTNATSYSWDFGDGSSSTSISPSHTYTSYGTYSVVLTSTNTNGSVGSTQSITLVAPPIADFTYTSTGLTVDLTNTSSNATSYSWNFGDGNTSTSTSPSHTYASAGTYTVVLTATGTGGSNQKSSDITVTAPSSSSPSVLLDFGGTSTPTGNWNNIQGFSSATPVSLIDELGASTTFSLTINKAFGGINYAGTTSPTGNALSTFGASSGNSTSDSFFSAGNSISSGFILSGLDATKVYSFDIFASRTPVSDNREAKYTLTGQNTAFATLNAANNTANVATISEIVPDATGKITFLMEKGANNTESTNGYIYLGAIKISSTASLASPTASYTYSASGLTVAFTNTSTNSSSYSWNFGDGSATSTATSPSHVYVASGSYTVVLTATNNNGIVTYSQYISVVAGTAPIPAFTYSVTDKTVTFTNTSSNSTNYSWDFGDGTSASTATSPTHTYSTLGNFTVQLTATNANGSVSTSKSINIIAVPSGGTTKRILFLSNSYIYTTNPMNIADILVNIANSAGDAVVYDKIVGSGWSLLNHVNNPPSMDAIRQGNWDFVSMNEYSHKSSFSPAIFATETFPYAKILNDTINKYNPCGETIFYQTWGYKQGDDTYCPYDPGVCTYEQMDDRAQVNYMSLGLNLDAIVNPVAAVRRLFRTNYPSVELYSDIYGHPTAAGSYISACCFYTTMFRKDPTLISYNYPEATDGTIDATVAANIRATVKSVLYDNLMTYYIGKYDLKSDFSFVSSGKNVTFTNLSKNANSYEWDFGDGTTSTDANPVHNYNSNGTYSAKLTANKCNSSDLNTQSIALITTKSMNEIALNDAVICYPNPVNNILHLTTKYVSSEKQIKIVDALGRVVFLNNRVTGSTVDIDFSHILSGVYFLSVGVDGKIINKVVVKK
ncbi:MAG: PKD domain-containing protein [Bacteroidales bacterium]|nr:PKD domain-containing protein [Bacteroidales bacterium]